MIVICAVLKNFLFIFPVEMESYLTHDCTCMQISGSITVPCLFAFL